MRTLKQGRNLDRGLLYSHLQPHLKDSFDNRDLQLPLQTFAPLRNPQIKLF